MKNFEMFTEELSNAEMLNVFGGNADSTSSADGDNRDSDDGTGVIWQ